MTAMSDEYDVKTDNLTMETCSVKQLHLCCKYELPNKPLIFVPVKHESVEKQGRL